MKRAISVLTCMLSVGSDIPELIPQEFFLIMDTLKRKVDQGSASPFELAAVAVLRDAEKMMSFASAPGNPSPQSEDGVEDADEGQKLNTSAAIHSFTAEDVKEALMELTQAVPQLKDRSYIQNMGLSSVAARAVDTR